MPNGGLGLVRNRHRYIGSSVDATQLFAEAWFKRAKISPNNQTAFI
jgi:hypothetical protein